MVFEALHSFDSGTLLAPRSYRNALGTTGPIIYVKWRYRAPRGTYNKLTLRDCELFYAK